MFPQNSVVSAFLREVNSGNVVSVWRIEYSKKTRKLTMRNISHVGNKKSSQPINSENPADFLTTYESGPHFLSSSPPLLSISILF